ncbi:MAG: metallophosphoesterase [bacterium]|nr:metallophosphoesterase [bacterium]
MRQILHISDVHFGPPHRPEASDGVVTLVERRRPDLVVISGDLTQRARPEQFREARAFVDRLAVPSLTVPGNHDVPMYRFWERLLTPFGAFRRHFATDLEPTYEDDEMLVVGVNTAFNWTIKDGRVTASGLRRLQRLLERGADSRARIVVAHHQLVPPPRFDSQRVLRGAHRMVDLLADAGVELVLSGHLHQSWIGTTEAYYPSGRRPVLLLHSGTSTSSRGRGSERGRNTCNWIRLDDGEIEISNFGWDAEGDRFLERSRHRFPRRDRDSYALEAY